MLARHPEVNCRGIESGSSGQLANEQICKALSTKHYILRRGKALCAKPSDVPVIYH